MNMIAEVRVLVFGFIDIQKALILASEKMGFKVPDQEIVEILPTGKDELTEVAILFDSPPGHLAERLEISAEDMKEALVMLCISRKVPVPRDAAKAVQVTNKALTMWIEKGATEDIKNSPKFDAVR